MFTVEAASGSDAVQRVIELDWDDDTGYEIGKIEYAPSWDVK